MFISGTKVMEKLELIVNSRQMKRDIPMLSPSFQTSSLEAYHSIINQFAPKMYKFSYFGMQSRYVNCFDFYKHFLILSFFFKGKLVLIGFMFIVA